MSGTGGDTRCFRWVSNATALAEEAGGQLSCWSCAAVFRRTGPSRQMGEGAASGPLGTMEQSGPPEPVQPLEDGAQTGEDLRCPAPQLQAAGCRLWLEGYSHVLPSLRRSGDFSQHEGCHTLMWSAVSVLNLETPAWDFALQLLGPSWESPTPGLHSRAHSTERIPHQPQRGNIAPASKSDQGLTTWWLSLVLITTSLRVP